ncbi:FAD-binding protein [Escherichia coli]
MVSVGRGIGSKENIALADSFARREARSWPVLVRWQKTKWMEHERYVGISNLMLKPELYSAGISGRSSTWSVPTHRKPFSPSTKIKMRRSSSTRITALLATP